MFKCLAATAIRLASQQTSRPLSASIKPQSKRVLQMYQQAAPICSSISPTILNLHVSRDKISMKETIGAQLASFLQLQSLRPFHAKGSKVKYMDFRYKLSTGHYRSHLLIIRRQKMKKHRRLKWRKKYKSMLEKIRLKREIAKEKTFRVELLTMIQKAEQFNPKEYALNKINEINNRPRELTKEELREELKEKIRVNRYQVTYIKPKHRRVETYGLDL